MEGKPRYLIFDRVFNLREKREEEQIQMMMVVTMIVAVVKKTSGYGANTVTDAVMIPKAMAMVI